MLSNTSAEPQPSSLSGSKAGATEIPALNPRSSIEVASTGTGTVNDPGGTDNKPPGFSDHNPYL